MNDVTNGAVIFFCIFVPAILAGAYFNLTMISLRLSRIARALEKIAAKR